MDKKTLEDIRLKLEKEKEAVENQLNNFAKKDEKLAGDWDTVFPALDGKESGSAGLEVSADEVEQYATLLPLEHSLEIKLKNINLALEKIEKEKYGACEKCKKEIEEDRLMVYPDARFCQKCKR